MRMTRKGRQRLVFLITALALVAVTTVALYGYRQYEQRQSLLAARAAGIEAYEAGHYQRAIEHLDSYTRVYGSDPDALYTYARARLELPTPGQGALNHAAGLLERVVRLEPGHETARHLLLQLYAQLERNTEALELADAMLEQSPNDTTVRETQAIVLARTGELERALASARDIVDDQPDNWRMQLLIVRLHQRLGSDPDRWLTHAGQLTDRWPERPAFELVEAFAYGLAGQGEASRTSLQRAADRDTDDADLAIMLVLLMDEARMFELSLTYLKRVAEHADDARIRRMLGERLIDAGLDETLLEAWEALALEIDAAETDWLGLAGMAMRELGRELALDEINDELLERQQAGDWRAGVWRAVLWDTQPDTTLADHIAALRWALGAAGGDAMVIGELARAYERAGEPRVAARFWEWASLIRPAWASPHLERARLALKLNRPGDLADHLEPGLARHPVPARAAAPVFAAWWEAHHDGQAHLPSELPGWLGAMRHAEPPAGPWVRLLHAAILVQHDARAEARDALAALVESEGSLEPELGIAIAQLSRSGELDLHDAALDQLEREHGPRPGIVLERALALAESGDAEAGRQLFEPHVRIQSEMGERDLAWAKTLGRYLERADLADAARAHWVELADAQPANPGVQAAALLGDALWADREAADQAISRLNEAVGEPGVAARVHRARWLLDAETDQAAGRAASLLRRVIEDWPGELDARLLLARAHEQLDMASLAHRELQRAAELAPDAGRVQLAMAQFYQRQGRSDRAREQLEALVDSATATPEQRDEARRLYEGLN